MKKEFFKIKNIPSILWGEKSDHVIIAVHGNFSNKADIPIQILSEIAISKGYQVLGFDLPEHGDRKNDSTLCKVQECIIDLNQIMTFAKNRWNKISIFGNSIGAYFSLMAFKDEAVEKAYFLSPVVNMEQIIKNMMLSFQITEDLLQKEEIIQTPIGQILYWDYYDYVKKHPVEQWNVPTYILYGNQDNLCSYDTLLDFQNKVPVYLKILSNCEHFFHTSEQLNAFTLWLTDVL